MAISHRHPHSICERKGGSGLVGATHHQLSNNENIHINTVCPCLLWFWPCRFIKVFDILPEFKVEGACEGVRY